jgi:ribosome-binding protein aMBF1 (putative translation factor)
MDVDFALTATPDDTTTEMGVLVGIDPPTQLHQESDNMAAVIKPVARFMEEAGISVSQLVTATGLDAKLVKSIVNGNYTPSPSERQRLAAALGVSTDDISWGHSVPVQHLRGNGPQCGRST